MTRISYGKLEVPGALRRRRAAARAAGDPRIAGALARLRAAGARREHGGARQGFLTAYTEGDNTNVVATDTMKNVILRHALEYDGATPEGFLETLGRRFLGTYPEMEGLRLWAREQPFAPVPIGAGAERSARLFSLGGSDHAVAELELTRDGLVAARSGQVGLRLLNTTGSAFTRFARDEATTRPERADRPLFIHLDVHWRYADAEDALAGDPSRYVAAAQARDVACAVFHEFVSESIQHLVHEMGSGCSSASRRSPRCRSAARTTRTTRCPRATPPPTAALTPPRSSCRCASA
jgi:urate oxidase